MLERDLITGRMSQGDRPDWRPLTRVMDEELVGTFMWMYEVETSTSLRIQAYKHIFTRRYVHLDQDGRAWAWVGGDRYRRVPLAPLLEEALEEWWQGLGATPDDVAAAWAAIHRARGSPMPG